MNQKIPQINDDFNQYFKTLLGEKLVNKYLSKIVTPMEEYTLHIFKDYEIKGDIIEKLRSEGFQVSEHSLFQNIVSIKPKGPYSLNITGEEKEIVVDPQAAEMIYQGADIFVPGVKRANKVKKGDKVRIISSKGILVATGIALMSHNDILTKKHGIAARNISSPYKVPSTNQLADIANQPVFFQSLPAYVASLNLEPSKSDKILDCCAAPGNKTIHLSELTGYEGKIIAVDRSKHRIEKLRQRLDKYKIKNITLVNNSILELKHLFTEKFDKILVDPPCTAFGLRPRLHFPKKVKIISDSAKYQKLILNACNDLLKSKGYMIYSTCTVTKEENEEIINYAIFELNMELVEQHYTITDKKYSISGDLNVQRFIPGIDKTLGFFIAKLRKK